MTTLLENSAQPRHNFTLALMLVYSEERTDCSIVLARVTGLLLFYGDRASRQSQAHNGICCGNLSYRFEQGTALLDLLTKARFCDD